MLKLESKSAYSHIAKSSIWHFHVVKYYWKRKQFQYNILSTASCTARRATCWFNAHWRNLGLFEECRSARRCYSRWLIRVWMYVSALNLRQEANPTSTLLPTMLYTHHCTGIMKHSAEKGEGSRKGRRTCCDEFTSLEHSQRGHTAIPDHSLQWWGWRGGREGSKLMKDRG